MNISMYQASVPVFIRMLNNLDHILKKGEEFARDKNIDPEILLNSRLAPDMFPLSRQIQIATDIVRRGMARLIEDDVTSVPDDEKTFAEFHDRIASTVAYLSSLQPEQVDGTEDKKITVKIRDNTVEFTGIRMLLDFSIPNLFFHITTAYNLLRHNGVELGKADFLGKLQG